MNDSMIKGTGNSRYLKSVANLLTLYPTYEDFAQALIDGTLPIDLNGTNAAGWQTMGTALNKATLLKDATAALFGKDATAVPDDIFAAIAEFVATMNGTAKIETGTYAGSGANSKTITFSGTPKAVFISNTTQGYNAVELQIPLFFMALFNAKFGISCSFSSPIRVVTASISWSGNSITITGESLYGYFNISGESYSYVAFM